MRYAGSMERDVERWRGGVRVRAMAAKAGDRGGNNGAKASAACGDATVRLAHAVSLLLAVLAECERRGRRAWRRVSRCVLL